MIIFLNVFLLLNNDLKYDWTIFSRESKCSFGIRKTRLEIEIQECFDFINMACTGDLLIARPPHFLLLLIVWAAFLAFAWTFILKNRRQNQNLAKMAKHCQSHQHPWDFYLSSFFRLLAHKAKKMRQFMIRT